MSRASIDEYLMRIAETVATRSTCLRRAVGCVLVDSQNRVLSTGYNGVARGQPHCNELPESRECDPATGHHLYPHACPGATAPSGSDLDRCEAIHAEQNALVQCRDVDAAATAYVTTCPCPSCFKLLLSSGVRRVVYRDPYPGSDGWLEIWAAAGRTAERLPP